MSILIALLFTGILLAASSGAVQAAVQPVNPDRR